MLDSLYNAIFRPAEARRSAQATLAIALLIIIILALNAAGATHSGVGGLIGFIILFLLAGGLGWYWFSASINLIAQLLGGQGDGSATMQATVQALWPLLLAGPAAASTGWSVGLGALFSLAINVGILITLVSAIRRTHQLSWVLATLSLLITLSLSFLALFGLFLWPLMIVLGT
ncbi:MAG: hypothetical protein QNJ46_10890 [Leptolyngbyaceae cyanobacterium MO_188.B28]|nr:hypothetical protein [Leptolyngbyaceae cyanobacterium MO_188.B28]